MNRIVTSRLTLMAAVAGSCMVAVPADLKLFCGDVHMHTIYSDGAPTPVGITLNATIAAWTST